MDIENYLKEAVRRIINNFNPEKIILFGSYAYGQPTVDSDIDRTLWGQTPKLTFRKRAAFTAGSGKPYRADNCRGVGRGVNIKSRMGRDRGGYEINDPILKSRLGYW